MYIYYLHAKRIISISCKVIDITEKVICTRNYLPSFVLCIRDPCARYLMRTCLRIVYMCDCVGVHNPRLDHCDIACDNAYASCKSAGRTIIPRYSDD